MRKTAFLLLAACGLCLDGGAVSVRSSSVSVEIDAANGRVTGLRAANGGAFPPCWSRQHPHPPGQGRWKTVAARRQMEGMIAAIRKVHGEGAATYEEPNEQFNDLVGIQLLRDSRPKMEWASLYGYLYHEYVPMFQPYPPRVRVGERHRPGTGCPLRLAEGA